MKRPYEFLIRWNPLTGEVQGAHVGFANVFIEDGKAELGQIDAVIPVAIGSQQGFPLKDVLKEIHVASLSKVEELEGAITLLEQKHAEQLMAISDAHAAEVQALKATASVSPDIQQP